jgi:hypothetical protein
MAQWRCACHLYLATRMRRAANQGLIFRGCERTLNLRQRFRRSTSGQTIGISTTAWSSRFECLWSQHHWSAVSDEVRLLQAKTQCPTCRSEAVGTLAKDHDE